MKQSKYEEVVAFMHLTKGRNCAKVAAEKFPDVSQKTLGSIYSQEFQRKMKRCHHKFNNARERELIYQRFTEEVRTGASEIILRMAEENDFSPALMARLMLEQYFHATMPESDIPHRSQISEMLKDTSLIPDPVLAKEVHLSVLGDSVYGCVVDTIKHSIGQEYEYILRKKVQERNLAFLEEDQLRARGYDKTPDCKLEVPIAVNGHVVNWIESKASFGDAESHKGYLEDQFWSYWNRFGPGLVIYWFGFIDEVDIYKEKGIMLMDHFPEDIVVMNPAAVTSR